MSAILERSARERDLVKAFEVLGGDLTVKIDLNTKQVIDFERGQ